MMTLYSAVFIVMGAKAILDDPPSLIAASIAFALGFVLLVLQLIKDIKDSDEH